MSEEHKLMISNVLIVIGVAAATTPFWYGILVGKVYFAQTTSKRDRHRLLIRWLNATGIGVFLGILMIGLVRAIH